MECKVRRNRHDWIRPAYGMSGKTRSSLQWGCWFRRLNVDTALALGLYLVTIMNVKEEKRNERQVLCVLPLYRLTF